MVGLEEESLGDPSDDTAVAVSAVLVGTGDSDVMEARLWLAAEELGVMSGVKDVEVGIEGAVVEDTVEMNVVDATNKTLILHSKQHG